MHIWTGYRWAGLIFKCEPNFEIVVIPDHDVKKYTDAYWSNAHQAYVRKSAVIPKPKNIGATIPLVSHTDVRLRERERFM